MIVSFDGENLQTVDDVVGLRKKKKMKKKNTKKTTIICTFILLSERMVLCEIRGYTS